MTRAETSRRRGPYLAVCGAALALGFLLAVRGALPFGAQPLTPLARVGYVLQQDPLNVTGDASALRADLEQARATLPPDVAGAFDVVVAVRGLAHRGEPDWAQAETACRALAWTRCDREALELLRKPGRP